IGHLPVARHERKLLVEEKTIEIHCWAFLLRKARSVSQSQDRKTWARNAISVPKKLFIVNHLVRCKTLH
ncbi:MAG: hypothetical protein MK186_12740, partial [Henriciella sp.]|nr:hypothetical protein [Henriciella sp.]